MTDPKQRAKLDRAIGAGGDKAGATLDPLDINESNLKTVWESNRDDIMASDPTLTETMAGSLATARILNSVSKRANEYTSDIDKRVADGGNVTDEEDDKYMAANGARKSLYNPLVKLSGYRPQQELDEHPEALKPLAGSKSKGPRVGDIVEAIGVGDTGHFPIKVMGVENGKVMIGEPHHTIPAKGIPVDQWDSWVGDVTGKIKVPSGSDHKAVEAIANGKAELLGRGDDGVVFRAGDKAVKVSTQPGLIPTNPGLKTPEQSIEQLRTQTETANAMHKAGVPGVLPAEFVTHGGKGFQIRPYVEIPKSLTDSQLKKVETALAAMHAKGFSLNDDVQVGIYKGEPVFFDVGKAELLPDNPRERKWRIEMDVDRMEYLRRKSSEPYSEQFSDSLVAGTGKAHDTLENTIDRLTRHGANVMARLSKSAVSRVLKSPGTAGRRKSLLDADELIELADMLASVLSTADLIGRARVRQSLAKRLGGWEKFADWDESEHPRDDEGQFVSGGDLSAAAGDSGKADELRKRVTKPEERAKLEKAIGGGKGADDKHGVPPLGTVLQPEEAGKLIAKIRAGETGSKNKGQAHGTETVNEPMVVSRIPISAFDRLANPKHPNDGTYLDSIRSSTDQERVAAYAKEKITTPIVVDVSKRSGQPVISDGGHRLMAAVTRGDDSITAIIPQSLHNKLEAERGKDKKPADTTPDVDKARDDYKRLGTKAPAFKAWFGDWDKDPTNASVVINDDGEPQSTYEIQAKPVFHGTRAKFDAFQKNPKASRVGQGIYFAENQEVAKTFTGGDGEILTAYLNIRKPFMFDDVVSEKRMASEWLSAAKKVSPESFDPSHPSGSKYTEADFLDRVKEHAKNGMLPGYHAWDALRQAVGSGKANAVLEAMGHDGIMHDAVDAAGTPARPEEKAEYGRIWIAFEPTQIKSTDNAGTFDPKDKRFKFAENFADPPTPTPPPYTLPATIPLLPPEKALDYFSKLVPTLGVDPEVYGPLMKRRAFTLAVATDKVILENVQSIIRDSMANGNAEVIADVQEVLDKAGVSPKNPQYAELVVRTNTMDAYNQGHEEERLDPDVLEYFPVARWDAIRDERTRHSHAERSGKYYPGNVSFQEVRGSEAEDVINCRCVFTGIFRDEWERLKKAGAKLETSW